MYEDELLDLEGVAEESSFIKLPDGTYPFTVVNMTVGNYQGKDGQGACKTVDVVCQINYNGIPVDIKNTFYLKKKAQGFINGFFVALGWPQNADGSVRYNFNQIIGRTGHCVVNQRPDKNDKTKTYNNIKEFVKAEPSRQPAYGYQNQPSYNPGYTNGNGNNGGWSF